MNPFASYRAINSKLCAKQKDFLSDKEWKKATEFKNVVQFFEFLKKKEGYAENFSQFRAEELHRGDMEILLEHYQVRQIEAILNYYTGSYREFFKTFLMEYEINDLQLILRTVARNENKEGIERYFIHSKKYTKCNYTKLLACQNVSQFIDALKDTPYHEALKTLVQEDLYKREFHMEMKLYTLFYKTLLEQTQRLEEEDRVIAKKIIGTKADFLNVQWIYRATKYYAISPEEILIYSLPFGNRLGYKKLKHLCYAKNLEEFKKLADKYLACSLFEKSSEGFLNLSIDKYIYDYVSHFQKEGENIARTLTYIYTLEVEIKDLTSLTEGIRYTLPESELNKYLVHAL